MIRTGYPHPIAYTYEAAHHCPECAARRFGVDDNGDIPPTAIDREGNPVGAVAPWDEWQNFTGEREVLACDTCGREIEEYTGWALVFPKARPELQEDTQ